jgi:hypothetical protein
MMYVSTREPVDLTANEAFQYVELSRDVVNGIEQDAPAHRDTPSSDGEHLAEKPINPPIEP